MADFVTPTYGLTKSLTQTVAVTMPGTTGTLTNAQLIANALPTGLLRTFLTTAATNDAAAETAFRNAGGIINVRQTGGTGSPVFPTVAWRASTSVPTLDVVIAGGASDEKLEISVTIPHSVIQ